MSANLGFDGVQSPLGLIALLATATFAWRLGGKAERLGALILTLGWAAAALARILVGSSLAAAPLFSDAINAAGLLWVALRYSSLWLGPAMLCYSGAMAAQAVQLGAVEAQGWPAAFFPVLDPILGNLVLAAVAGGTLAAMRRRRARAVPAQAGLVRRPGNALTY